MGFPRYLSRFESADGSSYTYDFPVRAYVVSFDQPIRTSQVIIAGASYPVDQLGINPGPKGGLMVNHAVRIMGATGLAVDDELDDMRSNLYKGGLGKIICIDEDGDTRWAWGRLAAMPQYTWNRANDRTLDVSLAWAIVSDWNDEDSFTLTATLDADPDTVVINNPGNARVYDAVITLKGPFTNPVLLNTTNGYQIATTRDGSGATKWLEIRAGRPSVRYSADSGVTYAGDYALVTLPSSQIQLMVFEPGNNSLQVSGANGADLVVEFDVPWE